MFYFKQNGDVCEKYEISFDKEKLENLKMEIINNCSRIRYIEKEKPYMPSSFGREIIKQLNYELKYIEKAKKIYTFRYYEYTPPYLVELIDQLLDGNMDTIDKILNYEDLTTTPADQINEEYKIIYEELQEISCNKACEKKAKLEQVTALSEEAKLNIKQQSVEPYYSQLIELIDRQKIDTISISDINEIEQFFQIKINVRHRVSQN